MITAQQSKRLGTINVVSTGGTDEKHRIRERTKSFVIHRPAFNDGFGWTVTHERSKLKAATVRVLADAVKLAIALENLGDWDTDNPTQDCQALIAPAYELCKAYR